MITVVEDAEFRQVWNDAEQAFRAEPVGYLAGVVAAFRWLGRRESQTPIHRHDLPPTAETVREEDMLATSIAMEFPGHDTTIARPYAAGVAAVLGWAQGILPAGPLDLRRPSRQAS